MTWITRLRRLFHRDRLNHEFDDELAFHLSMRESRNVSEGMPQADARRNARLRFGNPVAWRERLTEIDLLLLPQTILQDFRYGARTLRHNAGFTLAAVLALALGIGVNTAAFTAYKAFFKRSLDAREPARMVNLALTLPSGADKQKGDLLASFSVPDYELYRDQVHSFSGLIAASLPQNLTLTGVGGAMRQQSASSGSLVARLGLLPHINNAETASTYIVSENYFLVLGMRALRGRTFDTMSPAELDASPSVLISENYWQKRFAGDPAVLGKTVRLNGVAFTIIGITPHNFVGTSVQAPDFWLPLRLEPLVHPDDNWLRDRESLCCRLNGRLASDASMEQAQAEMNVVAGHLSRLHDPHSDLGKPAKATIWPGSPFPYPFKQNSGLAYARLLIMMGVGMVLVIACANVASLQLARAASRQNELGLRLSLGASRLRIIRQLLTESVLLSLLAGAVALLLSWAFLQGVVVAIANAFPAEYGTFIFHVQPDLEIFAYVCCISLVAGILFGLAPALESSAAALSSAMKAGTAGIRSRRMRDALMAAQVAVSLVLLIAGSMLVRSSMRALQLGTGYDSKQVVNLDLRFPEGPAYRAGRQAVLIHEIRTRLAALPGVVAISSGRAPDGAGVRTAAVALNGEKPSPQNTQAILFYTYVQPNYFQTLGIPLRLGRGFPTQAGQPESTVVVSESAAQLLWPGQNPIGRGLRLGAGGQFPIKGDLPDGPTYQVIGVAGDTRGVLLDGKDSEQIYLPMPEDRLADYPVLIRTRTAPAQIINAIGTTILSVDPNVMAYTTTLDEMLRLTESFLASSISAAIASTIGMLGLFLACMGIFGTVSYIVVLRTREVGIRMALGAKKRDVLALMLRESARPVLIGLLAGMTLSIGASSLLHGVLYGLHPIDPISLLGVSLLFLAIALFAAYVPSRRAMRVDPMVALRHE